MDIISTNSYSSNSLSNFAAHPFTFRGFEVNSMEGFLQGLKFKSPEMQAEVLNINTNLMEQYNTYMKFVDK